jgi:hypothetical protein
MSNSLTAFLGNANLPAMTDADMAAALEEASDDIGGQSGIRYLSFSGKTGIYALGRNKDDMDPDDVYLLEPQSIIQGWVCWKGNKPIDRVEWSIYQRASQAVTEAELDDHGPYRSNMGEGWQPLLGFGVLSTDGAATSIKFTATSKSGRNAIGDLTEEIKKRMMAGEPSMPLIHFEAEEFIAQEQKNFKPRFEVEAWVTREAAGAFLEGELDADDLIDGKAPKKKYGKAPKKK